ncbi:hypothetical protein ACKI2N_028805 [Cupriavidus sp. 30B13]|uniref:hypothetical protein n=1 Tax=Cupriavidus sp. 30B13 TaxID=3384241 RepID=UPI003B8FAA36
MNAKLLAKSLLTAATLAAAFATGAAQAGTVPADKYGYNYRVRDAYTDGARTGKFDSFTEGARAGKADPFTEGARTGKFDVFTEGAHGVTVAGLDRSGVSAEPARSADPYTDGARGNGKRNPFYDGARSGRADPYLDGANA